MNKQAESTTENTAFKTLVTLDELQQVYVLASSMIDSFTAVGHGTSMHVRVAAMLLLSSWGKEAIERLSPESKQLAQALLDRALSEHDDPNDHEDPADEVPTTQKG